jgi:hypothetical protein
MRLAKLVQMYKLVNLKRIILMRSKNDNSWRGAYDSHSTRVDDVGFCRSQRGYSTDENHSAR